MMAIGLSPASAGADTIRVDQQNAGSRNGGTGVGGTTAAIAQTFSVGISGVLSALDLGVFNPNNLTMFPDSLTIDIERTSAGRPGGTVLQSMTIPLADVTTDRFAPMTSFGGWNIDVVAGEMLAIVLRTSATGNYGWSTSCCYSGGDMYINDGSGYVPINFGVSSIPADFMFRTFVAPSADTGDATPEPASLLLLGSGLAFALFRRQNRPKVMS